jgi:hypothetical protein
MSTCSAIPDGHTERRRERAAVDGRANTVSGEAYNPRVVECLGCWRVAPVWQGMLGQISDCLLRFTHEWLYHICPSGFRHKYCLANTPHRRYAGVFARHFSVFHQRRWDHHISPEHNAIGRYHGAKTCNIWRQLIDNESDARRIPFLTST